MNNQNNNDDFCKLLYFNNINDFNILVKNIIKKLNNKNNKYKYFLDNEKLNFNNNLCSCNIEKHSLPDWNLKCKYKININKKKYYT